MRIYVDSEFIDTGTSIDLISIGMVKESGEELYCVTNDRDVIRRAIEDDWLRENVIPSLPVRIKRSASLDLEAGVMGEFRWGFDWDEKHPDAERVADRYQIMRSVRAFVLTTPKPELWAWYGAYDHVAIAQLFGRMHDLPDGFPMCTFDLKQEHVRLGSPRLSRQKEGNHNALADARHNAQIARELMALTPILPVPVDPNRPEPRLWEYPVGGICDVPTTG